MLLLLLLLPLLLVGNGARDRTRLLLGLREANLTSSCPVTAQAKSHHDPPKRDVCVRVRRCGRGNQELIPCRTSS